MYFVCNIKWSDGLMNSIFRIASRIVFLFCLAVTLPACGEETGQVEEPKSSMRDIVINVPDPERAKEPTEQMPGTNAQGVPFAVDETLSWEERKDKHMEACLAVRSDKFCAPPLKENYKAGDEFQDCVWCPVMVVIPPGSFLMGSPEGEEGRRPSEGPQHQVTIDYHFAIGKFEVTGKEWLVCVIDSRCQVGVRSSCQNPNSCRSSKYSSTLARENWVTDDRPIRYIEWKQSYTYLDWLSGIAGLNYRLPSESEWEYAARAGTTTVSYFGDSLSDVQAHYQKKGELIDPKEVGSYLPNEFGLFDMLGNVQEQVQDCWHKDYSEAPVDGSSWGVGTKCGAGIIRGGRIGTHMRSASREKYSMELIGVVNFMGVRVVRDIGKN